MNSRDLKPEQAEKLCRDVRRQIIYFNRLCGRMQKLRFPADDPLDMAAQKARTALEQVLSAAMNAGPPSPGPGPPLRS